MYILESKSKAQRGEGIVHNWDDLTPGEVYSKEEIDIFFETVNPRDPFLLFRARMLPAYGSSILYPKEAYVSEGQQRLSRDMPREIHELNDKTLTALGV